MLTAALAGGGAGADGEAPPERGPRADERAQRGREHRPVVLAIEAQVRAVVLEPGPRGIRLHAAAEVVDDLRRRREEHAPAGAAQPETKVHILFVEEEAFVEAADGVEGLLAREQARARQPVRLVLDAGAPGCSRGKSRRSRDCG